MLTRLLRSSRSTLATSAVGGFTTGLDLAGFTLIGCWSLTPAVKSLQPLEDEVHLIQNAWPAILDGWNRMRFSLSAGGLRRRLIASGPFPAIAELSSYLTQLLVDGLLRHLDKLERSSEKANTTYT